MLFAWIWCIFCDWILTGSDGIHAGDLRCHFSADKSYRNFDKRSMKIASRLISALFLLRTPSPLPLTGPGPGRFSTQEDAQRASGRGDKHVFENSYLQLETAWPASFQFQVRFLAQDPQGNGPKIRVQTIQLVTTCHFLTWTCGYYPPRPPPRVGDGGGEARSS